MKYGNIDSVPDLEYLPSLSNLLNDGFILFGPDQEDPDNDHREWVDERSGQTEIFDDIETVEELIDDCVPGRYKILRVTPASIITVEMVIDK